MAGKEDPHLGGSYGDTKVGDANTWMPDVWERLIKDYNITSVVDVGCGYGYSTKWFRDHGLHTTGIEGDPAAVKGTKCPGAIIPHDYTLGPLPVDPKDLAWCAEFVEHVEEQFMPNYMATFLCCKWVVITHGEPGQDGWHHVNCQTSAYWIDQFQKRGFHHHEDATEWMRATDRWKAGWGRRTLMMFHRHD